MVSPAVTMTLRWSVPFGESRCITDALHRVMAAARAQFGCVGCSVTTHVGRHVGLEYVEEWASEDDLRRELLSDRFTSLAALMESATETPHIEFSLPTGRRGLDYVEQVRAELAS
jgi:hypothetical protein